MSKKKTVLTPQANESILTEIVKAFGEGAFQLLLTKIFKKKTRGLAPAEQPLQLSPKAQIAMDGILVTMLLAVGTEELGNLIGKAIKKLGKAKATPFLRALNAAIVAGAASQKIKL